MSAPASVADYISQFPAEIRVRLEQLRAHVLSVAVDAEERISYGMPTYTRGKNIFHFAAYSGHIGLYPGPAAIAAHATEIATFKSSKGAIQVPLAAPLPLALITRLIQFNLRRLDTPRPSTKSPA